MSCTTFILEKNAFEEVSQFHPGLCPQLSNRRPYPAVQLGGELGLELTDGAVAVVSLDKDLGGQGRTPPQLLQVVHLGRCGEDASR